MYICKICKYTTTVKSNYTRHNKSSKHTRKQMEIHNHICEACNKYFSTKSNLSKHMKTRCKKLIEMKRLIDEIGADQRANHYSKVINNDKSRHAHDINNSAINQGTINNISIKNYLGKLCPNAPALQPIDNYGLNEGDIKQISYEYRNKSLCNYFGEVMIKNYLKDDPRQQSLWTSDNSRLTFIVSKLMKDDSTIWVKDANGLAIKEIVLNEMLKIVHANIADYMIKQTHEVNVDGDIISKFQQLNSLGYIQKQIEDGKLANDVLRYIGPHFTVGEKLLMLEDAK